MSYVQGDLNDRALYEKLHQHLHDVAHRAADRRQLPVLPGGGGPLLRPVVEQLGHAGLLDEALQDDKPQHWRRVVIEKPFGHSLASARALNTRIRRALREEQIYRIDHFLGKETVQNIMAFRFANGLFEPIWNRDRIDHVQITVAETVGVEHRGKFYEVTGALRDMVPNHVFQLLAMVAMEPPVGFDARLRAQPQGRCVHGPAHVGRKTMRCVASMVQARIGRDGCVGYREEPDVAPGFRHRNLRGDATGDRQLALGGRAVLPAHRQAHVAPLHGDRHSFQARAICAVRGYARRRTAAELAGDPQSSPTKASRCNSR